jgi:transglutaminase-like putative cysteine protease
VQTGWLLATSLVVLAPLTPHVPVWLTAMAGLALAWRGWLAWRDRPLPARWLLFLLVATGTGGVLIQFRTLFGQNPGVALLVVFLALKLLETRSTRDGLAIVFLAYFLALAQFFYSQSIQAALATAAATLVATAALASLTDCRRPWPLQLKSAGTMLVQATPFMLLLFLLFPRIQGPLWGLPKDAHSALTGLSETMAPGSISQLSQSDAIAFRVRFSGPEPARRQLYWRGPVLSEFDGRVWRPEREQPRLRLPYPVPENGGIEHEITLEPHGKPWLFALELPGRLPPDTLITRHYQLLAKAPVVSRQRYEVLSFPELPVGLDEADPGRRQALALPAGSNPRLRALAATWRAEAGSDQEVLNRAQAFFLGQQLTYTLEPPLLGEHAADEFLFDTRQGFCEHFANAFAVAMRAAGIPARVVTGYQGGEMNPVDGFMIVHQYDAHAWTEVWLAGRGWLRVDPTAISAPSRIDLNLASAVPLGDPLPFLVRIDAVWLQDLRFRWDAVTNAWNQWVLGYTPRRQRELLTRLGMSRPDWQSMTAALAILSGTVLLGLAAWTLRRRQRQDPAAALWARLSRRLARRGLARQPWEGPSDYAERVAAALPERAAQMRAITRLYTGLRYGQAPPRQIDELRRLVASFKP